MAKSSGSLRCRSSFGQSARAPIPSNGWDRSEASNRWSGIEDQRGRPGSSAEGAHRQAGPDAVRAGGGIGRAHRYLGERSDNRAGGKGSAEVLTKKKTIVPTERQRASVADQRVQFVEEVRGIPAHKLVFIDETGSHIAMTPEYAWAPVGQRAIAHVPRNRGTVTTIIGALAARGMTALMTVEGGTSGDVFLDFICGHLAPSLRTGDVVVMDNLAAHHVKAVRNVVEGRGARILFTPAYSPDLNPIELCWSKLKSLLKGLGARTREGLHTAIGVASSLITRADIKGWFHHCFFEGQPK